MRLRIAPLLATLLTLVFVRHVDAIARAQQTYATAGSDNFSIGSGSAGSEVRYKGKQWLRISQRGKLVRYSARVSYTRSEQGVDSHASAMYVADVLPSGELASSSDRDPDYLTVLNQPFAAQLDAQTLADLRHLRKALPFDFPSPFTGSSLHGYLQHRPGGTFGKHAGVAVSFEATGGMNGALPDRADLTLAGRISMHGTAYYDAGSALLLALDTTVMISGTVMNHGGKDPVRIVYARSIRALP